MNTEPRSFDATSRHQSPSVLTRPAALTVRERTAKPAAPGILDAVRDQNDGLWIHYGSHERALWLPIIDFARPEGVARLINLDPRLIEPAAQRTLRSAVAKNRTFRPALVAAAPGWTGHSFILGDGSILAPPKAVTEVIATFQPHPKFTPFGTLVEWQAALSPVAARQPLVLFALALAFVGPLLPFLPPDYLTPLFEVVGAPGTGKSTLGVAAASVWAGDRDNASGGGETWNLTPGRFDEVKLTHRHTLLLLDEANLAGATLETRRQLIHHAVFGLTSTGVRQRMGDPPSTPNAQLAVLSTSNRRLCDLIEGSAGERGAMHERMITIPIAETRRHGVLDTIPTNFENAAQAVEALRAAGQEHWGTAGPTFVRALQREALHNEVRLRGLLARALIHNRNRFSVTTDLPRVQKSLALVSVAGVLAQRWGIIPIEWGCPASAVRMVAGEALGQGSTQTDPRKLIRAYAEQHRTALVEVASLHRPLTREQFDASRGFLRRSNSGEEVLIPAGQFQTVFPHHETMMRQLRTSGQAQTEIGRTPKLTIKTPRAICGEGRVYCIRLADL